MLVSWRSVQDRVKEFFAFLLLLEFGLVGVFMAQDLFLFYVFWEVSLVPMYFLIGIWGHDRRIYAAVKFFLYTMAGSVLMLVAIIYLYNKTGTFSYPASSTNWPAAAHVHTRRSRDAAVPGLLRRLRHQGAALPAAHLAARRARGSAHRRLHHAGVRHAEDGHLRYSAFLPAAVPVAPRAQCAPWIAVLAIIGILYGALVAMVQPNMKKLVAYSSVSHLGFRRAGNLLVHADWLRWRGLPDAQSRHLHRRAVPAGRLLYERRHSLEIADYGGVATVAPWLSTAFLITTLASIGLPMLEQFRGRIPGAAGHRHRQFHWTVWAALGVIFSACYMLWLYQRVFYGETSGRSAPPHARHETARVGRHRSAHRDDGVDGRVLAELPARR
jgi:NADH-quinone oxidoreductase subunit M